MNTRKRKVRVKSVAIGLYNEDGGLDLFNKVYSKLYSLANRTTNKDIFMKALRFFVESGEYLRQAEND